MTGPVDKGPVPSLPVSGPIAAMVGERGYVVLYRPHETNRCPGCAGAQWLVGRVTAECARCHLALPLVQVPLTSLGE